VRLGVPHSGIAEALSTFQGVKRRQELIFSSPTVKVYEDFAHHPTAVRAVLETMRRRYPHAKIYAVYEPRSATSRRNSLQQELSAAFQSAGQVFIKRPFNLEALAPSERIDIEYVVRGINSSGVSAALYESADDILQALYAETERTDTEHIVIIMSNGGFDGIYEKIIGRLSDKRNRD
jgi:UDP-N-acetylmuramate: L-alanyl-gamma-D-glutamyl-meso-diaminopimelate ligase